MPSNQNRTFLLCLFMNRLLEEIMFVEVFILADGSFSGIVYCLWRNVCLAILWRCGKAFWSIEGFNCGLEQYWT